MLQASLKQKGESTPRKGTKRMRKAIKNARGLISDLFQRERFSTWLVYEQGASSKEERPLDSARGPKTGRPPPHPQSQSGINGQASSIARQNSRTKLDAKGRSPLPQDIVHVDPLDSIGSLSESEALAEERSTATSGRQKTALDTLSTIGSDENWDEFDRKPTVINTFDDVAAMVQPGLYIGAFLAEQNRVELEKKGITHVLQVGDNLARSYEGVFHYHTISVSDTESADLLLHFNECFEFIDAARKSGGGVLVHCFAGISRSATVCIGYLIWKLNLSLGAAYSLVESARSCTQPNEGFRKQLQVFENLGGDLDLLEQWCSRNKSFNFSDMSSDPSCRDMDSDDFDL